MSAQRLHKPLEGREMERYMGCTVFIVFVWQMVSEASGFYPSSGLVNFGGKI